MKTRNTGIDLLRIWMAFAVVGCHCEISDVTQATGFAVPVFMTLAFFFAGGRLLEGRVGWLKDRLIRLYLPFLVWALVAFVIDRLWLGGAAATDPWGCNASWRSLAVHLIGGTALANNLQMWFIGDLVWLTPIFFLFLRRSNGRLPVWTLSAVATLAVMAQYSGLNPWIWNHVSEFGLRIPGGRLLEMVPYCCAGLLLWSCRERFEGLSVRRRWTISLVALAIYIFLTNFKIFCYCRGFAYSGLHRASQAFAVLAVFYFLPFERLPAWISRAIGCVAAYSMGVYMMHVVLLKLCEKYLFASIGIASKTLLETLVVFVLSWLVCFLLARLPKARQIVT